MRKINRLLLILAIIAAFLTGCKKDTDAFDDPIDNVFNISFSRNALEYVNIPVGKYFVYNVIGYVTLDSIVVTSSQLDTVHFARNDASNFPEHNIERLRLRMTKYNNLAGGGTVSSEWLRATALPDFFNPFDSTTAADIELQLSGTDQNIFYAGESLTGAQTMVVQGITYTGVISTESDNGLATTDPLFQKNTFYWARGAGIIKRINVGFNGATTTWELLRHN